MTKDEALTRFFTSLRVAFKSATMYKMNHPAFLRCVEDLWGRVQDLFSFLSPLAVGITPRSLFADGRFWEGERIYRELGQQLHLRKIKSLEIRPGIALDELVRFLARLTLPLSEFVKEGGASGILKEEKLVHIAVEELDYGELLKGEGEEIKDLWPYLLQEAVDENDGKKIREVAESFNRVIDKYGAEDIIADEGLQRNFSKLFAYLKENEMPKYRSCAKSLIKTVVTQNKHVNLQAKLDNLGLLVSDLEDEDLVSTLWEEIISDDQFDSLSFGVFSKIVESDRNRRLSTSLGQLFQTDNPLNRRAEVGEKIRALLSGESSRMISEVYRQTLASLLKTVQFDNKIAFDHDQLSSNYRYILLNTLVIETEKERRSVIVKRILTIWDEIVNREDYEYLACLQDVLLTKRNVFFDEPLIRQVEESLGDCIERAVLEGKSSPYFERLISGLTESRIGIEAYLAKIFDEGKLTPFILRIFYRFYKEQLDDLTSRLKGMRHDVSFLNQMISAAKAIDSSLSVAILKNVYNVGDEAVRLEALKAMGGFSEIDKNFLFSVLKSSKTALQGQALAILSSREATRKRALDRFLRFQSPYGLLNKKLRQHIRIVEDMGLKAAAGHLGLLSRRKSSWNRSVRKEAQRVLERWNESQN